MDQNDRKRRQVQRMAETAQPLQPAENHPIKDVSLVNQIVRLWEKATPEERQAIRQRVAIDAD